MLAGAAIAVIAALATLAFDRRELGFVNGVIPLEEVATLAPGAEACQREVGIAEPFAAVRIGVETSGEPGPPLEVAVRGDGRNASGEALGGYVARRDLPETQPVASVGSIDAGGNVDICITNRGERSVALIGVQGDEAPEGQLEVRQLAEAASRDLHLSFLREEPTSLLAVLPQAFARAALFHPPLVGAWTFWLLALAVAVGVPLALAKALRAAEAEADAGGAAGD